MVLMSPLVITYLQHWFVASALSSTALGMGSQKGELTSFWLILADSIS